MKHTALALIITGLASGNACAQSGMSIYGIVDTSLHYLSSDNAAGNRNLLMDNGAIANSRLGFKGSEDLGGGGTASFRLEHGFHSDSGAMSSPGILFNRQSWLGIGNAQYGQLSLGRQNTPLFDLIADHFDPLTVGNYTSNSWMPAAATLVRTSNMLKYGISADSSSIVVSYAPGEQAGAWRQGSQFSSAWRYSQGPLTLGTGFQQTASASNATDRDTTYSLSAAYVFNDTRLMGGYYRIMDRTGTTTAYMADQNSQAASGGRAGIERRDHAYFFGIRHQLTPAWSLATAVYLDRSKQLSVKGTDITGDGRRLTLVTLAEYALSKRTQLYGTVDRNQVRDTASVELPGRHRQTGVAMGIRHMF